MGFLGSIFCTSTPSETGLQVPLRSSDPREAREAEQQLTNAQAACWLFETTSNLGDQISTARFILTVDKTACASVFSEDARTWRRFVILTKEAFEAWRSQPSQKNQEVAELFGVALFHVPLPSFSGIVRDDDDTELPTNRSGSAGDTFLQALELASTKYPNHKPEDEECLLHIAFLTTMISQGSVGQEYQWDKPAQLLLSSETQDIDETLLGLWAKVVYSIIADSSITYSSSYTPEQIMKIGEDKEALSTILSRTLFFGDTFILSAQGNSQSELNARQGYLACLRKALDLTSQTDPSYLDHTARGLADLIRNYIDPLTASGAGETSHELVRFSVEAVLGLHAFIRLRNSPDPQKTYVPKYTPSEKLLNSTLIDATADMMLEDLGPPADGMWSDRPIKPSLIRILLWVWKNTSDIPIAPWEHVQLLDSTRRLWAPWEEEVDFSKNGNGEYFDKPLTSDDLNRIFEFIEFIKKDQNSFAFISCNADVGINRLYVHLEQRAEWEYQLYDMREQHMRCSRSGFMEDGLP